MAHAVARGLLPLLCLLSAACGDDQAPPDTPLPTFSTGRPPAPMPPPGSVGGFAIELPPVTLEAGQEAQPCFIFPLEVQGPSRVVSAGSLQTGAGLHHGNITTRPKTGEGARPCPNDPGDHVGFDILQGGAVLFASSTQVTGVEWQGFPPGMGYHLRDGFEIVARMHYLNPTAKAVVVQPRYEWYTIAEADLKQEVAPFAWTYSFFKIPPMADYTVESACTFAKPMHVVNVLPHMHGLGRRFTAGFLGGALDGKLFLDDQGYGTRGESDVKLYQPAIDLSAGDGATFSCTWRNTFDKVIGEGVGDNEMCILFGYAYPPENAYSVLAQGKEDCLPVLSKP